MAHQPSLSKFQGDPEQARLDVIILAQVDPAADECSTLRTERNTHTHTHTLTHTHTECKWRGRVIHIDSSSSRERQKY